MAKGVFRLPISAGGGTNISDATATEPDVVFGKTFYAGALPKRTGTMLDNGTVSTDITTKAQEVGIASGKHSGAGIVKISAAEQAKIIAGNIKKDITILGVTGTLDASPDVVCPTAGYEKIDDGTYTAPVNIGTPTSEEIRLLCSNEGSGRICFYAYNKFTVTITDDVNNQIYTANFNSATKFSYTFPTSGKYYIVKITPQAGYSLTQFLVSTITGYSANFPIFKAIFNTPNITTLSNAFYNILNLKECIFQSSMNYLTTLASAFYGTGIGKFTFPSSLPVLTTMDSMFYSSLIRTVDFNHCSLPLLTTISNIFINCYDLYNLTINFIVPKLTNLSNALYNCVKLKGHIILNFDLNENAATINCSTMFYGCILIDEITFINFVNVSSTISLTSLLYNCNKLSIIHFRGQMPAASTDSTLSTGVTLLKEVDFSGCTYFGGDPSYIWSRATLLQKIKLPTVTYNNVVSPTYFNEIVEVSGTGSCENTRAHSIASPIISVFNCPNLKANQIIIGYLGINAPITAVNFDIENSFVGAASGSPSLRVAGSLTSSTINALFTRLPTVSVARVIDVSSNPGYATCNKTIATAKGWTVT